MKYLQSPHPREVRIWVSTVSILISLNTGIARSVRGLNYKGTMQKTQWRSRTSCRKFWWLDNSRSKSSQWKLWISKQSSISCGAGLSHSMDPDISVQNKKTSQEPQRSLQKFLEPERKPKVIYTDNSLEFGKACEDFPGINARLHHIDQRLMGSLKEQCAE